MTIYNHSFKTKAFSIPVKDWPVIARFEREVQERRGKESDSRISEGRVLIEIMLRHFASQTLARRALRIAKRSVENG